LFLDIRSLRVQPFPTVIIDIPKMVNWREMCNVQKSMISALIEAVELVAFSIFPYKLNSEEFNTKLRTPPFINITQAVRCKIRGV